MSRSGYVDDLDYLDLGRWRGQVASAIRGKRGQALLRDMLAALDAMPEKVLIMEELVNDEGDVCALGSVGKLRGIDMADLDPEEPEVLAGVFGVAPQLIREVEYENDEAFPRSETPQDRWKRMRQWVASRISTERPENPPVTGR